MFNVTVLLLEKENFNLTDIITPVKSDILEGLLLESGYKPSKIDYLVSGFRNGFELGYNGPLNGCQRQSPNLKLRVGNKVELWNKVMKEVELGRYAGPFIEPSFKHYM